jgi:hypothetical protein
MMAESSSGTSVNITEPQTMENSNIERRKKIVPELMEV